MNERNLDGIRVDGVPLAEVIKDQRDNRVINHMSREVSVQMKCKKRHPIGKFVYSSHQKFYPKDRKPSKGRYLTKKELEEAIMEKEIKKINAKGLTIVEAIYIVFKENGWGDLKSRDISFSCDIKQQNISPILSKMFQCGMVDREEKEPNRFYYRVNMSWVEVGRLRWAKKYRDFESELKRMRRKSVKKKDGQVTTNKKAIWEKVGPAKQKATPIVKETNKETRDRQAAEIIHLLVDKLNFALKNAIVMGLNIDIQVVDFDYKVSENEVCKVLTIDHTISRIL